MNNTSYGARVLIYSHDTMGLGHLRRCSTIAHALVEENADLSVLILSGSPIIGSFDFHDRVDFVRIPGVIKLHDGEYTSLKLLMDIEETVRLRASIIRHTAMIFDPDVFIVDKEPLGLRGEVAATLRDLKPRGTRLVLGLRDVIDDPDLLIPEWERKKVNPALRDIYDEIWVYGLPQICNPLEGMQLSDIIMRKIVYTGYLRRTISDLPPTQHSKIMDQPYILVTTGGGGDGDGLIDWVLRAYESDAALPYSALLVLGPFMQPDLQTSFIERATRLQRVDAITFDAHLESIAAQAIGIVAMGGYNTFCEILSLDKPALIVPRSVPRLEQTIRASRAQDLGLVEMLTDDGRYDPATMATALRKLPHQRRPSEVVVPGLLEGLVNVNRLTAPWIGRPTGRSTEADNVIVSNF